MIKTVRVWAKDDNQYGYGKSESNFFGQQYGIAERYLAKKIGKRGVIHVSQTPVEGYQEARLVRSGPDSENFKVTAPKALKGHELCAKGISSYFATAGKNRLKFYFRTIKS